MNAEAARILDQDPIPLKTRMEVAATGGDTFAIMNTAFARWGEDTQDFVRGWSVRRQGDVYLATITGDFPAIEHSHEDAIVAAALVLLEVEDRLDYMAE